MTSRPDGPPAHLEHPRTTWREAPGLAARGALVGMVEAVPGISGGTVALVVGLYDALVDAAGELVHAVRLLVTGVLRGRGAGDGVAALRAIDWRLLAPVGVGMVVALVASLSLVAPLYVARPVEVRAALIGMMVVSVVVPLRLLPHRLRLGDAALLALGAGLGFVATGLPPGEVADPAWWYVLVGAALAINALVIPGLSGSFVLLVLGLYVPATQALRDGDVGFVAIFALGAALGLASFVKLLRWLLHHRRQVTLALLSGLMVGSLRALWPWQDDDGGLLAPSGGLALPVALALAGGLVVAGALVAEAVVARRRAREGGHDAHEAAHRG